jgi:hypothetical protein
MGYPFSKDKDSYWPSYTAALIAGTDLFFANCNILQATDTNLQQPDQPPFIKSF